MHYYCLYYLSKDHLELSFGTLVTISILLLNTYEAIILAERDITFISSKCIENTYPVYCSL